MFKNTIAICIASFLLGCTTTVEEERTDLRSTIEDSRVLARDISVWRENLVPGEVTADSAENIEAYRDRADDLLDRVQDVSEEAAMGMDLQPLKEALRDLETFDLAGYRDATATARAAVLDQFQGLAQNLMDTTTRLTI